MSNIEKICFNGIISEWVIGTPPVVDVDSSGFSTSLQISYNNLKEGKDKEQCHKHLETIEECYLVLEGTLTIEVNEKTHTLEKRELLKVPAHVWHRVVCSSENVEYLTIRAPISHDYQKVVCNKPCLYKEK
jgi:mannose-6-phosphate isomerase-like protein (cupin superfamily)